MLYLSQFPRHSTTKSKPIVRASPIQGSPSKHIPRWGIVTSRKFMNHNQNFDTSFWRFDFRSYHRMKIRRSWYSVLPSLDAMITCCIKKAVVGVTQLIAALVSIHSSMTLFADMCSFLDPPSKTVLFSVDDNGLFPVDCMIGLIHTVGKCWHTIFRDTGCALTSGKDPAGKKSATGHSQSWQSTKRCSRRRNSLSVPCTCWPPKEKRDFPSLYQTTVCKFDLWLWNM